MRRFFKNVTVSSDLGILLDDRPVRTPAREYLTLPNRALAEAIAEEWRTQGEEIDPQSMPLTGLANAAIDRVAPARSDFADGLARYVETELLCYRASEPPELVERQEANWGPVLAWAAHRYDVRFEITTGIMHVAQPRETLIRLSTIVTAMDDFTLAALSPLVTISGSIILPLALLEGKIGTNAAFDAAHLDELWQVEQWGEDDLAVTAREKRRADFHAAFTFAVLYTERS